MKANGNKSVSVASVSQQLLDEITEGGKRDLTAMTLTDIEREVYQLMDLVGERVLRGVVEDQAIQIETTHCPKCKSELVDAPGQERSIKLKRNTLTWLQPVKRCQKCRCDFFPSGASIGVCS